VKVQTRAEKLLEGFKLGSLGVSRKPKVSSADSDVEVTAEPQKQDDHSFAADPSAFNTAVAEWMKIATQRVEDNAKQYKHIATPPHLSIEKGKRYWKIVIKDSQTSVFAFIDTQNGNVYKAASWRAPAKHARGNIFDFDRGARWIGPYGMAHI